MKKCMHAIKDFSLGLGCSTVLYPEAAAIQAASILGLHDHVVWSRLRVKILNNYKKILLDDSSFQLE